MLYLAGRDDPGPYRGTVIDLDTSPFAPDDRSLDDLRSGATDGAGFTRRLLWQWRAHWRVDRSAFLDVIALATGGTDVTLRDGWADVPYAPRRILAGVLRRIARSEGERRRRACRLARVEVARASRPGGGHAIPHHRRAKEGRAR